jgi:hypothetical protein
VLGLTLDLIDIVVAIKASLGTGVGYRLGCNLPDGCGTVISKIAECGRDKQLSGDEERRESHGKDQRQWHQLLWDPSNAQHDLPRATGWPSACEFRN